MPYFTKAYPIARLRAFPEWPGDDEDDDSVVFVHPDFSVRKTSLPSTMGGLAEDGVIWVGGSDSFQRFCELELAFPPR